MVRDSRTQRSQSSDRNRATVPLVATTPHGASPTGSIPISPPSSSFFVWCFIALSVMLCFGMSLFDGKQSQKRLGALLNSTRAQYQQPSVVGGLLQSVSDLAAGVDSSEATGGLSGTGNGIDFTSKFDTISPPSDDESQSALLPFSNGGDVVAESVNDYGAEVGDAFAVATTAVKREALLSSALACYKTGRDRDVNYFFNAMSGGCEPLPTRLSNVAAVQTLLPSSAAPPVAVGGEGASAPIPSSSSSPVSPPTSGGFSYVPPPDVTMMTVLESIDRMKALQTVPQRRRPSSSSPSTATGAATVNTRGSADTSLAPLTPSTPSDPVLITVRRSPSEHSRWLFNDWRLWEGELGCGDSATSEESDVQVEPIGVKSSTQQPSELSLEAFATFGSHRTDNFNRAYQIDNFCINEEDGGVIGFEYHGDHHGDTAEGCEEELKKDPKRAMHIDKPDGRTDRAAHTLEYEPNSRMFHPSNQIAVPLVRPVAKPKESELGGASADGRPQSAAKQFEAVVSASLQRFYKTAMGAKEQHEYPSVMFVHEPALLYPLQSDHAGNPAHSNILVASHNALRNYLGATSIIFTQETVAAQSPSAPTIICSLVRCSQLFNLRPLLTLGLLEASASLPSSNTSRTHPPLPPLPTAVAVILALPRYLRTAAEEALATSVLSSLSLGGSGSQKEKLQGSAAKAAAYRAGPSLAHLAVLLLAEGYTADTANSRALAGNADIADLWNAVRSAGSGSRGVSSASDGDAADADGGAVPRELLGTFSIGATGSSNSVFSAGKSSTTVPKRSLDYSVTAAAAMEAAEVLSSKDATQALYASLLSSGADGCEAYRCQESFECDASSSSSSFIAAHRRCAIPYVSIAVSSAIPQTINVANQLNGYLASASSVAPPPTATDGKSAATTAPRPALLGKREADVLRLFFERKWAAGSSPTTTTYLPDTANYSRSVWNTAVRMIYREARRLRRDALGVRASIGFPLQQPQQQPTSTSASAAEKALNDALLSINGYDGGGANDTPSASDPPSVDPSELMDVIFDRSSPINAAFASLTKAPPSDAPAGGATESSTSHSAQQPRHPYSYMLLWRRRLVQCMADPFQSGCEHEAAEAIPKATDGHSPSLPVYEAYFEELFAVLLERLRDRERAGGMALSSPSSRAVVAPPASKETLERNASSEPPQSITSPTTLLATIAAGSRKRAALPQPQPQLICYRKAFAAQVRVPSIHPENANHKGQLIAMLSANCHTREVLELSYKSAWARYGMCSKRRRGTMKNTRQFISAAAAKNENDGGLYGADVPSSTSDTEVAVSAGKRSRPTLPRSESEPAKSTYRDAHPIFTLPQRERADLQKLFASSKVSVEGILSEAAAYFTQVIINASDGRPFPPPFAMERSFYGGACFFEAGGQRPTIQTAVAHWEYLAQLVRRVDTAQRRYDDVFMRYFEAPAAAKTSPTTAATTEGSSILGKSPLAEEERRGDTAATVHSSAPSVTAHLPSSPAFQRPIGIYHAHRSKTRPLAHWREMLSVLLKGPSRYDEDDGGGGYRDTVPAAPNAFGKYVRFEFNEGLSYNTYSLKEAALIARSGGNLSLPSSLASSLSSTAARDTPLQRSAALSKTPRAHRYHALMSAADLLVGSHGADLHVIEHAKPTAMAMEMSMAWFELTDGLIPSPNTRINSGYFAPLAFGRNIGYLRSYIHRVETLPDPIAERGLPKVPGGFFGGQALISLTDLRQTYALTICTWLATNLARLTDDDAAAAATRGGRSSPKKTVDRSYLLPWWCRGGASAVVRDVLKAVANSPISGGKMSHNNNPRAGGGDAASPMQQSSQPVTATRQQQLSLSAVLDPNYFSARGVPSHYGLVEPFCPPLFSNVTVLVGGPTTVENTKESSKSNTTSNGGGTHAVRLDIAYPSYKALVRVQSECSKGLTVGTQGDIVFSSGNRRGVKEKKRMTEARRLKMEGLQTLLEAALLVRDPSTAQHVARLMVEGVGLQLRHVRRDAGVLYTALLRATAAGGGGGGGGNSNDNGKGGTPITASTPLPLEPSYWAAPNSGGGKGGESSYVACGEMALALNKENSNDIGGQATPRRCLSSMLSALMDPLRAVGLEEVRIKYARDVSPRLLAAFDELDPVAMGTDADQPTVVKSSSPHESAADGVKSGSSRRRNNNKRGSASSISSLLFIIHDNAVRQSIVEWIVGQFFRVEARPTMCRGATSVVGDEYSYGNDCKRYMPFD